jgi:hypothetical protein
VDLRDHGGAFVDRSRDRAPDGVRSQNCNDRRPSSVIMRPALLLLALLPLSLAGVAAPTCARTIDELKSLLADQDLPLMWRETTMDDGKPLVLSIREHNGLLFLQFVKTDEGLWAEGVSVVCRNGTEIELRFVAEKMRMGPAANWAVQYTFTNGGQFTLTRLGAEELQVAMTGWSGKFSSVGVK